MKPTSSPTFRRWGIETRMTIISVLICALSLGEPARVTAEREPVGGTALMQSMLGLTSAQLVQVSAVFQSTEEDCTAAQAGTSNATPANIGECMAHKREAVDTALAQLLSAEQMATLQTVREARNTLHQGAESHLATLNAVLDLTVEQQATIGSVLRTFVAFLLHQRCTRTAANG